MRHGLGIQLYGKTSSGSTCKYAGEWCRDKVEGDGHYVYPDGSEFKGNFNNGVFQGHGMYTWPSKHCFIGDWVDGKMHGSGEFTHENGQKLKGSFANNMFELRHKKCTYFVDPLQTSEEHQAYINLAVSSKKMASQKEEEKN